MKNRELPKKGQRWKHFKGWLCEIIDVATHSETNEQMVVYKCSACITDTCNGIWARPLSMFMSAVETDKYPEATQEYRFEKEIDGVLFRGERVDEESWEYGYYVKYGYPGEEKHYIVPNYASALYAYEVDPETIGQFTGFHDRCHNKMFVGDVLLGTATGDKYKVIFSEGCFQVSNLSNPSSNLSLITNQGRCFEVIGNIHENPELMEGKNGKN